VDCFLFPDVLSIAKHISFSLKKRERLPATMYCPKPA